MTESTKSTLATLAPAAALLALGLGALLAYAEARFLPTAVYAQEHAGIVADVADVRTAAAGDGAEVRGEIKAMRSELTALGKQLDRIERIVEQALARQAAAVAPVTRRGRRP